MPYEAQNAADLRRQIAEHQANLMRLGEAWGQRIVDELDAADRETIARLQDMLEELKYERNTAAGIDQLERIRKAIEKIRVKAYAKAEKKLRKEAADLIQNEAKWARRILFAFAGLSLVAALVKPKTQEQKWLEQYAKEHPLPEETETEKAHKAHKHRRRRRKPKLKRLPAPTQAQIEKAYTIKNSDVTKTLTEAETKRIIKNSIQLNKRWDEWWTHTADVDVQRVADAINEGVNNGQTVEQVTATIRGTKENNFEDGLLSKSRQDARRMARTITVGIANDAKDQFYRDNSDVVLGVEWLDTLDGRTCFDCASLSRMQWKVDEQHPIPPLHPNCRCVLLPVTALSMLVDEARPAAKSDFMADAKRMYEAKYPSKRFEDLAESTRKKYYYDAIHEYEERTGQPAFELVHGRVSFKDYFENVMTEQQRKDWLGPQRYKIWRHGNLSTDKFINPYPNRQFTVDELKELDKNSFAQKSPVTAMERSKPLTREEVEAVLQYTRSDDYAELNSYLRTGKTGNEYFDTETRLLNAAISKTQTTEDMIVWRGVKSLTLRQENQSEEVVRVTAFTSTSTSLSIAKKFAGVGDDAVIYKITLPKGTNAIDAMGISRKPEEDEILLPPTGFFKQSRVYYEKDTLRQIVEVIYEQ